jgi:hypothetical protein
MASDLPIGTKLLGHLIDFDPGTPETQVMLERTDDALQLTIAWTDHSSAYAQWFSAVTPGFRHDEVSVTRDLPSQLLFHHTGGTLFLLGCEVETARAQFWGTGTGVIRARYAISNTWHTNSLERINGLRSGIPGLRRWLGVTSISQTHLPGADGQRNQLTYVATEPEAINVGGPNALRLAPTWRATPDLVEDTITLHDRALCETTTLHASDWDSLLADHRAIRDLLVLSAWKSEEIRVEGAYVLDEPEISDDGSVPDRNGSWYSVEFAAGEGQQESSNDGSPRHLIEFGDLGPKGIARWLELRKTFARAVDPIVSSKIFEHPSINVHLSLAGMGAEALGYLIAVEAGRTAKQASDIRFADRLRMIADTLDEALPFDLDEWVTGTTAAYNAIKHANRDPVGLEEMVVRWHQTTLAFRMWFAHRLGVPLPELARRIENDALR